MKNNNSKGILYILVGMAIFSIQDALIKFVYEDSALYELYFGRTLTAAILLISYLIYSKQKIILKTRVHCPSDHPSKSNRDGLTGDGDFSSPHRTRNSFNG